MSGGKKKMRSSDITARDTQDQVKLPVAQTDVGPRPAGKDWLHQP